MVFLNYTKKLFCIAVCLMLMVGAFGMTTAYAAVTSTTVDVVLLLDKNASVPSTTTALAIAAGSGIAAVPGTSEAVLAPTAANGVTGTPTIGSAVFAPGDTTTTSVTGMTLTADEKAVVKSVPVNFAGVTFAQPGIFRYLITEPTSGGGITYDTNLTDTTNGTASQRVLDVYVDRVDSGTNTTYEISGYVLHEKPNAPAENATSASDKSPGFVNRYATSGLTLECQVTGNQSSVDKYFKFDITIENPSGTAFTTATDWSAAGDAQAPVANPASVYPVSTITAANTNNWASGSDGTLTKTVYLRNGQKVAVDGIPIGAEYEVTVTEEDYGPTWTIKEGSTLLDSPSGGDPLDDTDAHILGENVQDVKFILTRAGTVPTGIFMSALPGVAAVVFAMAVIAVIAVVKKRNSAEA